LVHRKTKEEINLKSFYLRESYIDAFSESLKLETHLKILNLSRNQLTTNRLIKIIQSLPKTLTELNLSNNPQVAMEAYRILGEDFLELSSCKLDRLMLEGCKINDEGAKHLAKNIEYNTSLRFLDLSRNMIQEAGALELA
jgi:Leucine-rich repeat (LRR) protein